MELNLPCAEMLEATLFHLYTGQAPEPLPHGGHRSLTPDQLFGLLSNAKYLLIDGLVEHCGDFLIRLLQAAKHEGTRTACWVFVTSLRGFLPQSRANAQPQPTTCP